MNAPRSRIGIIAGAAFCIALFGASLIVTCLVIHHWLPIPEVPEVKPKLAWLKLHADDYDTLFVGTSHIYRQIDPATFDHATAEFGRSTHSFNAGVDGMQPPEDAYLLDQILNYHPKQLRWVFIEAGQVRVPIDPAKRGTERAVYWHDWERLSLIFKESVAVKKAKHLRGTLKALVTPLGLFCDHLGMFVTNMSNLGRGSALVEWITQDEKPPVSWIALGPNHDGYLGIEGNAMNDKDLADYRREMAARKGQPIRTEPGSKTDREALLRMVRKIEAIGAVPIIIVPPIIPPPLFRPALEGRAIDLLDFSEIERYPDLYSEPSRMNASHLNATGAVAFSKALAERFAKEMKDQPKAN